ncbi:hypothetical protein PM082_011710 [Marasmius tenuissimus]|nr:hypothetical protein PM082_011710 [Marasmius tenuissimus]
MRCVEYELDIQRKIEDDYPEWKEKQEAKEAKKKQKRGADRMEDAEAAGGPKKKRRVESLPLSDNDQDESRYAELDISNNEAEYIPSGTKSRPKASRARN